MYNRVLGKFVIFYLEEICYNINLLLKIGTMVEYEKEKIFE